MIQFMGAEEEHVRQMAALLARRQEREREQFPFLPRKFEEIDETEPVIRHTLQKPHTFGIVAVRGIEVIGFLLYTFKGDEKRGRYIEIDYAASAVAAAEHPRLLRMMYAEAGAEWVKHGYFHHVLTVPLSDGQVVSQWLEQGFSYEQKYALLPLESFEPRETATGTSPHFREGNETDRDILRKVAAWNSIHQTSAPSWNPITKETMDEVRQSYEELVGNEKAKLWFAERQGQVAGFHVYFPAEHLYSLLLPEKTAELAAAATNPAFRGKGMGTALANYCFMKMKQEGFDYLLADWHTPNHLSSYFWPRLGFQPVAARLARKLDSRISWARGE